MKRRLAVLVVLSAISVLGPVQAEDLLVRGARVAATHCAECHGRDGAGVSDAYPRLAGQHAEYIVKQVFNFKTGQRRNEEMDPVLEKLLAVDIRAVAQHYAQLRPRARAAADPALVAEGRALYFRGDVAAGVSTCASCHGVEAAGGAQMPRLAGQNRTYLETQMKGFIQRARQNDALAHLSMRSMGEREVRALAAFLSAEP